MPGSLDEAVRELEADHEFLLQGGVFSQDLIDSWIDYKRENDIDPDAAATAPARVRALLRRLIVEIRTQRGPVGCEAGGASAFPKTSDSERSRWPFDRAASSS